MVYYNRIHLDKRSLEKMCACEPLCSKRKSVRQIPVIGMGTLFRNRFFKEAWLMPARWIVYPLFFVLKDFLIAYLLAKIETPKKPEIGFFPIGVIASVSELSGFWFIQMLTGESTVRHYGEQFPVVAAGFAISAALCVLLLFLLIWSKKQFSKETAVFVLVVSAVCVAPTCAPYALSLTMDSKTLNPLVLLCFLLFLIPVSASVVMTNIVFQIYKRCTPQKQLTDFRSKEVKWSYIAKMIGWALTFVVWFVASFIAVWNKKSSMEVSLFWQLAPFVLAVIVHFIYLSESVFEIREASQKRNLIWLALLTVLNAPYSILFPLLSRFVNMKPFFAWLGINTEWLGI